MDELAKSLNLLLKENESYKHYLKVKEEVDKNVFLIELREKMEKIKRDNCKSRDEEKVKEYYRLEREYKDHILVKEYESSKEEIYDLLKEVSDILSFI